MYVNRCYDRPITTDTHRPTDGIGNITSTYASLRSVDYRDAANNNANDNDVAN